MYITHSYIETSIEDSRANFYLLYQDYIQYESEFSKTLQYELERLARNLKNKGSVVQPFKGDIEHNTQSILEKFKNHPDSKNLYKTPCILMINSQFSEFNPTIHPYVILTFNKNTTKYSTDDIERICAFFQEITRDIVNNDQEPFNAVKVAFDKYQQDNRSSLLLTPNFYGIGVDLPIFFSKLSSKFKK